MLGVDTEFIGVYDLDNAITCGIGLLIRLLREGLDAEFFGLGDGEDSIFAINVSLFFCDLLGGGLDAVFGGIGGGSEIHIYFYGIYNIFVDSKVTQDISVIDIIHESGDRTHYEGTVWLSIYKVPEL